MIIVPRPRQRARHQGTRPLVLLANKLSKGGFPLKVSRYRNRILAASCLIRQLDVNRDRQVNFPNQQAHPSNLVSFLTIQIQRHNHAPRSASKQLGRFSCLLALNIHVFCLLWGLARQTEITLDFELLVGAQSLPIQMSRIMARNKQENSPNKQEWEVSWRRMRQNPFCLLRCQRHVHQRSQDVFHPHLNTGHQSVSTMGARNATYMHPC